MVFLSISRLIFTKNPLDIYSLENKCATHKGVIKMDKICTFSGAYGGGENDPELKLLATSIVTTFGNGNICAI